VNGNECPFPDNKKDVGYRLAIAAEKVAYGDMDIVYSGPVYKSFLIDGHKIIISFTNTGSGLVSNDGEELSQFAIAGMDKKFVWAKAQIEGDKVVVWNDDILIRSVYVMRGRTTRMGPIYTIGKGCRHRPSERESRALKQLSMSANKKCKFSFSWRDDRNRNDLAALVLFPAFIHAQGRPDSAARQAREGYGSGSPQYDGQLHIDSIRRGGRWQ